MTRPDSLLWQRWDEVDRLLSETLDLPPPERGAHVRHRTADDVGLRDLVLRLVDRVSDEDLDLYPSDEVVLAAFAGEALSGATDAIREGDVLGSYRVVRRIGRGGMATVYEAERADGAYDQRVALKVLRAGLDTEDIVRRFLVERQILSSLTHPHIGRLLDGGSTASGRPFLVMELVSGDPITIAADQRRMDVPTRLRLFLEVVDAVRAAHRQLVVHRDIKPSNVLVDSEGRVKLVDFGIAKLLDRDDGLTDGAAALTPQYASPEQLQGGRISTATDVYQLGLLLRELLTGVPPRDWLFEAELPMRPSRAALLDGSGAAPSATVRAAARKTGPERLAKALRGDLDIIVGKAMRPDPEERYTSADEFAADVTRYLLGHAIVAHPESNAYRLRKFMGRHPFAVPGALAAVGALVAFSATVAIQNGRIARERDAQRMASERALATQEFLVNLLSTANPTGATTAATQNPDITVGEALQRGRARIASELADQPEVRGALLIAIGRALSGIGRHETADTVLWEAYRVLEPIDRVGERPEISALLARGDNHRAMREFARADSAYSAALSRLPLDAPDTARARVLRGMSMTRRELGEPDSAVALANGALTIQRRHGDSTSASYVAGLGALALALRSAQQLDSAEVIYRVVIARMEENPDASRADLAFNHNNLGFLLRNKKDYDGAQAAYRSALAINEQALGPTHVNTQLVRQNLAGTLELAGQLEDAFAVARENIAAAEAEWPHGHWRIGSAYAGLGRSYLRNRRYSDAVPLLETAVRIYHSVLAEGHEWTLVARTHHGAALLLAGRRSAGLPVIDEALRRLQPMKGKLAPDSRDYLSRLATMVDAADHSGLAARIRSLLDTPRG